MKEIDNKIQELYRIILYTFGVNIFFVFFYIDSFSNLLNLLSGKSPSSVYGSDHTDLIDGAIMLFYFMGPIAILPMFPYIIFLFSLFSLYKIVSHYKLKNSSKEIKYKWNDYLIFIFVVVLIFTSSTVLIDTILGRIL